MSRYAKIENVLKRSEELVGVGQNLAALNALHETITSKRARSTALTSLEPLLLRFIELCVDLQKGKYAKEGLHQFKNIAQNTSVASIDTVVRHFLDLSEKKVVEAQAKAAAISLTDVEDLEATETPESILLSTVSTEQSKDRTDRAIVTPWLKFLWEAYRTVLDVLRNNARLETFYQDIATDAYKFCLKYERRTEFRRLGDLLRNHLQNVVKYSHQQHAINISDPDTLQRYLDTRFAQLSAAVELELWQEAFRSVEDIHNLLMLSKKAPRSAMMATYYDKLARIFLVSNNWLFHAASLNKYHVLSRAQTKSEEEQTRLANLVLVSSLAVPIINVNKARPDLLETEGAKPRTMRLMALLGLSRTPKRASLVREALERGNLKRASPTVVALYNSLEVEFHPLSICRKIAPVLEELAKDVDLEKYIKPLHSVVLTRLLQQLSQVYDTVRLDYIMSLTAGLGAENSSDIVSIENAIMTACNRGELNIRIDHEAQSLTFQENVFGTSNVLSAVEAAQEKLQPSPSDLVRTQLSRFANALYTVIHSIDDSAIKSAQEVQRKAFANALSNMEEEHSELLKRKTLIERRKLAVEKSMASKEQSVARDKALRAQEAAEAERKRLESEAMKRDFDRKAAAAEAIRLQETRNLAENLMQKGGLKIDMNDLSNMDTTKLVQLQVEQLEREKREMNEKLRVIVKRVDHLERAYRKEEAEMLVEDYERQKKEDQDLSRTTRELLIADSKTKHEAAIKMKQRLHRILPDYNDFRSKFEQQRHQEFAKRRAQAEQKIAQEKERRRSQALAEREAERRRVAEEEERVRLEEEARREQEEEEARIAAEREAEKEAKRAADKEKQRKLDEQAAKQREAEERAEQNRLQRAAERVLTRPSPFGAREPAITRPSEAAAEGARYVPPAERAGRSSASPFGSARPVEVSRAPRTATSDDPERLATPPPSSEPASGRPKLNLPPSTKGGWREREAAKRAAEGGVRVGDDATPPRSSTPLAGDSTPRRTGEKW